MPSFSEQTAGVAQSPGNLMISTKTANFTVGITDFPLSVEEVGYDLSSNVTVGVTATIPPNSTYGLPVGMRIVFLQGVTGTTVITAGAGVTLVGGSATVAATTARFAVQVSLNRWFLY